MDTLAINEKLLASDFSPQQANAITTAIAALVSDEDLATKADIVNMATKSDIANLETRLTNRMISGFALVLTTVALLGFFGN